MCHGEKLCSHILVTFATPEKRGYKYTAEKKITVQTVFQSHDRADDQSQPRPYYFFIYVKRTDDLSNDDGSDDGDHLPFRFCQGTTSLFQNHQAQLERASC